jgi:hypothetical protein
VAATVGYADNLEQFLTGISISGSVGPGNYRFNLGGNTGAVGVGIGTPGVGATYGFGPYRYNGLPPFFKLILPNPHDPLVLDLTGAGIQLTSVTGSPAHFDFTGSGFAMQTGWITPTEGMLVLDNGQGGSTITVDELLGAQSGDGFGDLAGLDSNGDGVIDASDPAFANLKV